MSQGDVMTTSHQYVSTTSQISLKWITQQCLSGMSPRRLSGTYAQRPISTSLWRLLPNETPNNVAVVRLNHVSELRCRDALSLLRSLLRFQITLSWPPSGRFSSFIYTSNQTPHFSSTNQEGNKRSSLDYKLVELLLHLKTASYINNICNIFCVNTKKTLIKNQLKKKWRNFDFMSIVKFQNLISRISVPPIQKQLFADVLPNSCF